MKKTLYLNVIIYILLFFGVNTSLKAQVPNPVSFNTAVDASLSGTIPLGNTDLSWTASSVTINGPYVPAVRASNQIAWLTSPYPTADWITYPHSCTSNPVDQTCIGTVDEYYRLMFTLPATACNNSVSVPGGYCLTMNYFADNCVSEIFVNGISSFTNPVSSYITNNFTAGTGQTVTICNNWQAGTNTLVVHVKSGPPTTGFLAFITATATTPGGYSVTATQTNVSCFASANGAASVSLPGYTGPVTYTWLPTGGNGPSASNLSPGIYTVNIQMPLCNLSNTLHVTQPASFAVNVFTPQTKCAGNPVTFTSSGAESYAWSPGNLSGSVITLTPTGTTVYTVTATDSLGCKATKTFTVRVLNCAGMKENTLQEAQIHSNSSGNLSVTLDTDEECQIEIFDLNGQLKYNSVILKQSEIDLSNLPSGIYLLKLSDKNSSYKKRIMVSH